MKARLLSLGILISCIILFAGCKKKSSPPLPSPSFSYTVQNAIPPITVVFANTSTNYNASGCLWDFKDGSQGSRDVSPTHIFQTAGTYNVGLQVTGDGGTQGTTMPITIGPKTVKISSIVMDSVVQLNSPMTLYFTLTGGTSAYTSIPQTWTSGYPISTWVLNPSYASSVDNPVDIKVYWTVQNSLLATLTFTPKLYTTGLNPYPSTVSLRYLRGTSETKVTLHLQWE